MNRPWSEVAEVIEHVDRTEWHGVYLEDHFMADGDGFGDATDPRFEVTTALSAVAMMTRNVRIAPLVMSATYRHPAVVANWAATVDRISGGRLTLGLGAGWQRNEHEQYGLTLGSPGERVDRLDEYCTVVRTLLDDAVADISGRYFSLSAARCEPKPIQARLPLLIGGKGDRMLGLVARRADAWNLWSLPDRFRERARVLDAACDELGRDPATITRSTQALVLITDDAEAAETFRIRSAPRAAFAGTVGEFADLVGRWAEEGVDEVIVPDWFLGAGHRRLETLDAIRHATGK